MADKTDPKPSTEKPIVIPTGNDEPNPKQDEHTDDTGGMPTWAKELQASMAALTESLKAPQPSPSPTPKTESPIPQPPPPPKPETQPVAQPKKQSALASLGKFLFS